jgi:hypothetical protein
MKDTFILKTKYGSIINRLSDKQAGVLFKMLFNYVENGANAGSTDERVDMAFEFIKMDLDAFSESYQKKVEANKENGKRGGNPNFVKGKSNPYYKEKDNPNITEDNRTLPKITEDNPNDNVNDNVNDNDDKDASAITGENKYYSSDNGVIKSISELKRDYLNDENLCNAIIKNLKIVDKNMLSERLEAFNQHLELQGERLKEVRDYRSHFKNWLKKRQEVAKNTPVTTAPKRIRFDENGNEITY